MVNLNNLNNLNNSNDSNNSNEENDDLYIYVFIHHPENNDLIKYDNNYIKVEFLADNIYNNFYDKKYDILIKQCRQFMNSMEQLINIRSNMINKYSNEFSNEILQSTNLLNIKLIIYYNKVKDILQYCLSLK